LFFGVSTSTTTDSQHNTRAFEMALRNILPLHKSDGEAGEAHHHEKRQRANGHIVQKESKKQKRHQRGFTSKWRNEFVAMVAEFCGTFLFLFFAFGGTQVANTAAIYSDAATAGQKGNSITQTPNTSVLLYISLIFGFSLMVNVWVFFRVSGGLFNPAVSDIHEWVVTQYAYTSQVTLGLYLIGALTTIRAVLCFISQMLAGMCAAAVVSAMFPGDLNVSTTLGSGVSIAQGVFMEMFLTSLLIITIFMLAAEKHKATFLAPIGIGLALFVAEMVGVFYTGGSLNPARSFGPCVVTRNFPGYHYIYWFGPCMGTLLAFGVYKVIKMVEYQTVNPGQDFDDHEVHFLHSVHTKLILTSDRTRFSSPPPTPKVPQRSSAPTSPQSPPKKLSASLRTAPTTKTKKKLPLAASTARSPLPIGPLTTRETGRGARKTSTGEVTTTTTIISMISSTCRDRRIHRRSMETLSHSTHRIRIEQVRSTGGRVGIIWRVTRNYWPGRAMHTVRAVRGRQISSSRGCNGCGYKIYLSLLDLK
jgi:aquaporin related protein